MDEHVALTSSSDELGSSSDESDSIIQERQSSMPPLEPITPLSHEELAVISRGEAGIADNDNEQGRIFFAEASFDDEDDDASMFEFDLCSLASDITRVCSSNASEISLLNEVKIVLQLRR